MGRARSPHSHIAASFQKLGSWIGIDDFPVYARRSSLSISTVVAASIAGSSVTSRSACFSAAMRVFSTAPLLSFGTFTVHQVCALALWSRLALRVVDPLQALDLAAGLLALALVVVCAEKLLREIALHGLRIEVDVVLVIRVRLIPRLDLLVCFEECFFGLERGWPVSCLRNALKLRGGLRYATVEVCPLFVHRAHCDLLGTLRFSDVGNGAGGKSDGLCNPHAHRHLLGRDQWLIG